jgi:primosomal protein N' (replication factor Y)
MKSQHATIARGTASVGDQRAAIWQGALFGTTEPGDGSGDGPYAGIVLNRPVDQVFTYRVPSSMRMRLQPGARVSVPLGRANQPAIGYCVRIDPAPDASVPAGKIKDLLDVFDVPPLIDASMLELTRWMARYYACSWGQALDAVVPAGVKKAAGTRLVTCLNLPDSVRNQPDLPPGLPPKQAEILALLKRSDERLTVADVCRLARCTTAPIAGLKTRGLLTTVRRRLDRAPTSTDAADPDTQDHRPLVLTGEQRLALDAMRPALEQNAFHAFLLHGVTGSGKTEVYLSAIEQVVARGREAIVLVPEISLTPQTIRRFRRRFARVAVLHSHLSDAERHRHWKAIAEGSAQVVVGARSAVFAPTRNLGLIVIDEEHEASFKQEITPRYHARDVAVKRAQLLGIPVILGSATPALESWRNADLGRYTRLTLAHRVMDRPMPPVELVDMRHEKPDKGHSLGGLSRRLKDAMTSALNDGGQVILLLNRRGFHTFILCPGCGHVLQCDNCDVALTHHKNRRRALCHTCDSEREPPEFCPACQASSLHYGGIGTERLEREVRAAFPDVSLQRMDSDTMRSPGSHERVLKAFKDGDIRILLGTQMIAKGLDFPNVTLVGVVTADTALHLPDFRAAERTFQLVAQVAGRTGRGQKPGRVIVQTYAPDHPAILAAATHDYLGFVGVEMDVRKQHLVPPFGRLVRLLARGKDENATFHFLIQLADSLRQAAPAIVRTLGPAPAPVAKIRNEFRFHLRLYAPDPRTLQTLLHEVLPRTTLPPHVELAVDVDPVSML